MSVDPNHTGTTRLSRGDLIDLAGEANTDKKMLNSLWNILIWGSGRSTRNNILRMDSFVSEKDRERNICLLTDAASAANEGDAKTAYSTLIKRGGGRIRGLSPAFFTKFLYFNSARSPNTVLSISQSAVPASNQLGLAPGKNLT